MSAPEQGALGDLEYWWNRENARQEIYLNAQASEKLNAIRSEIRRYTRKFRAFESFLIELFEVIFGLSLSCSNDIHVLLKDDSPNGDKPRAEIWIYEDSAFELVDRYAVQAMEDFATKMNDLEGVPQFFQMVCTLRSANGTTVYEKSIGQHSSRFNVSSFLTRFPNRTLDCGWFRSAEGQEGTPVNPNLVYAYEQS